MLLSRGRCKMWKCDLQVNLFQDVLCIVHQLPRWLCHCCVQERIPHWPWQKLIILPWVTRPLTRHLVFPWILPPL